jgi:copper chaperone NosL
MDPKEPEPQECFHDPPDTVVSRTRRQVLFAGGTVLAASLAGCSGDTDESPPEPVTLAAGLTCDVCGMVVADHPGPIGEIFYADTSPSGHDNPARFDSLRGCLFPYYFEHERNDWMATAVYVTDYSKVDATVADRDGDTFISSHTGATSFTDATEAVFVVGSGVQGAMGPDIIPFGQAAEADDFVADQGGEVLSFDEITPATLSS